MVVNGSSHTTLRSDGLFLPIDESLTSGRTQRMTRGYTVNLPMLLFLSLVSCRVTALDKKIIPEAVRKTCQRIHFRAALR